MGTQDHTTADRRESEGGRRLSEFQNDLENALARIRFDQLQGASAAVFELGMSHPSELIDVTTKGVSALQHYSIEELNGLFAIVRAAIRARR